MLSSFLLVTKDRIDENILKNYFNIISTNKQNSTQFLICENAIIEVKEKSLYFNISTNEEIDYNKFFNKIIDYISSSFKFIGIQSFGYKEEFFNQIDDNVSVINL